MTVSAKGSIVFKDQNIYHIPTQAVEKVVDTTGAGDSFAAGFLYGFDNDLSVQESAALGNIFAGGVITQVGARLDKEKLLELIE
jgi:sugar/nucleoside kinase (ribokinase family)